MKTEKKKSTGTAKVPVKGLLALVAERLKGRDLFPEKTEEGKQFLRKIKGAKV
jgi:hypothetical protein